MVTVSFGLALLSRRFLEQPALRLKRYFEYAKMAPGAQGTEAAAIRQL